VDIDLGPIESKQDQTWHPLTVGGLAEDRKRRRPIQLSCLGFWSLAGRVAPVADKFHMAEAPAGIVAVPSDFKGKFQVQIELDLGALEVKHERTWHSIE
jgi:hypothetical protein